MNDDYLNYAEGLRRLMNNKALYKKLLLSHVNANAADTLIEAIQEGETTKIARTAHTLKGAALNLSLTQIGSVAAEIERRAANDESAADLTERLRSVTAGTSKAIQELIDLEML